MRYPLKPLIRIASAKNGAVPIPPLLQSCEHLGQWHKQTSAHSNRKRLDNPLPPNPRDVIVYLPKQRAQSAPSSPPPLPNRDGHANAPLLAPPLSTSAKAVTP
jgi:hypothetical protein